MAEPIIAHKVKPTLIVEAVKYNESNNNKNVIYVKSTVQINEETANAEKEFKYRQEFNEFYYDYYVKRGKPIDDYTKNRIWESFKYEKMREERSISTKIANFIAYLEDKFDL
jgi:hypothetical protein